ncbi:hypothetical protein WHR41_03268 [Cladosporium halotolerans]|uniref:Uncharacterized protein n=1 Tax=Cladosporium halotolerans TaxID=1052096 RepID=A0AB34KS04_9PEZI
MAPIRRYLRITKFSVLEVRIYPEQPADAPWLLSSRDPVLPRVLDEVRPLVLPKLREENENARKKGGKKKKGIRDVAAGEDFEVVMFLTEGMARHSIVTRGRVAEEEEGRGRLRSSGKGLAGWLNSGVRGEAITVEDDEEGERALGDIPEFGGGGGKRRAGEEGEALFVSSDDETVRTQRSKRRKRTTRQHRGRDSDEEDNVEAAEPADEDDKKKLALKTSYDGFSIYGRILCLIVKRKGKKAASSAAAAPVAGGSQMMENWVSTQVAQEAGLQDDDEDG